MRMAAIDLVLVGGIGLLWATTSVAFAARRWWLGELCSHFRAQYAGLFLACAAGLIWLGHPAAVAAGLGGAVNLAALLPAYGRMSLPFGPRRRGIKALLLNVDFENRDYDRALRLIRLTRPELVAVIEVTHAWRRQLATLRDLYPYMQGVALRQGWGLLLLSRLPFRRSRTVTRREGGIPYVMAQLRIKGREVTVLVTHPFAPVTKRYARARNRQLEALARVVSRFDSPLLVLGDLNCSPWSPYFRRLLRATGLRDSRQGFSLQPTWPVWNPLLGIPIDHCLVSADVAVHDRRLGQSIGSDHWPVFVEFSICN